MVKCFFLVLTIFLNRLNGVDVNSPEWMFSKMIRSAQLKFNDYSIRRLITILGNLGNWQRVIQVIEWLQARERFQSHKPRYLASGTLSMTNTWMAST
jgi:hypothetical protein